MNDELGDPRALWRSVIAQATFDALQPRTWEKNADLDRDIAQAWFLGNSADFREVCEMAELDPTHVRQSMIVALEKQRNGTLEKLQAPRRHVRSKSEGKPLKVAVQMLPEIPNQRKTYTHDGVTDTLAGWARRIGVKRHNLASRIDRGKDIATAMREATIYRDSGQKMGRPTYKTVTV